MDKVSVIVPIYNSEKTIKKCMDSIINQNYTNIEIILVNDGSKDKSLNIISEYEKKDARIIIINQENKGLSGARNTGIKSATGKYITFVDSDDYIDKDMIQNTLKIFEKYDCDIVRNNYKLAYQDGNIEFRKELYGDKDKLIDLQDKKTKLIEKILLGKIQSYSPLLTIKKELLKNNKLLFDEDILFMEDIVFFIKLLLIAKNMFFINEPKYYYYQSNSSSLTKNQKSYIKNMKNILIIKQRIEYILRHNLRDIDKYIKIMNTVYTNALIGYLRIAIKNNQDYSQILQELKKLREDDIVKDMLKNGNTRIYPIRYKIYIFLFEIRKYQMLTNIFKFENLLRKIWKGKIQ